MRTRPDYFITPLSRPRTMAMAAPRTGRGLMQSVAVYCCRWFKERKRISGGSRSSGWQSRSFLLWHAGFFKISIRV